MRKTHIHLPAKERARELAISLLDIAPNEDVLRARDDFAYFCEYVTRNSPEPAIPAKHHLGWHKELITGKDSKCLLRIAGENLDILAPRGSAKSTVLGLYVAWAIGIHTLEKKPLQILYISYSLSAARAKSATIKAILESAEYQEIFPCVRPSKRKWADDYWSIDRVHAGIRSTGSEEFTMVCAGIGGSITSKRSSLIVLDDVIKSAEQIANPDVREKMTKNWGTVIRPTMLEGARVICLGTRFRPDDIHCTTFTPAKGWKQIEESAILEDENGNEYSYWEDFWSLAYLQQLRKEDSISFSFQFQNRIIPLEELGLNPEWITIEDIPPDFDAYAVGIDLAASLKTKADFTVLMLLGRKDDKFYFLDYRRGKWQGNMAICDALLGLYGEWHEEGTPFTAFVESQSYQASFKGDFISYIVNQKQIYDLHCQPWNLRGDKLSHLLSISGIYANGLVSYNKYKFTKDDIAIKELTDFGATPHDDCVDSACLALQGLGARRRLLAV